MGEAFHGRHPETILRLARQLLLVNKKVGCVQTIMENSDMDDLLREIFPETHGPQKVPLLSSLLQVGNS